MYDPVPQQYQKRLWLLDLHKGRNEWLDKANMYLDYAKNAAFKFEHGTYQEKADIAHGLGANLILMDRIVGVELLEPYIKFKDNNFVLHQKPNELELANALVAKDKSEITDPVILSWWARRESVTGNSLLRIPSTPARHRRACAIRLNIISSIKITATLW